METIGHSVRATIDFNGPLNALATSPNKRLIAVGGRDVLKVVALESTGFTERRNLRVGKSNLNFSTNDIRWHPQSDSLLATAATNGAVVIWNLQKDGFKNVQERVLSGHHRRAVNRICWHTTDASLLLSGSQDGSIKLWDTRGGSVANTYQPKSESVRDVRVSSFQPNKFAAAFENGIIQIWDMRKNTQPELKFQAHKGLVLALDWHPSKPHLLASGGRDRYVKVWDLGDVSKPKQTIQTIASVGRVAWRPTCADHIATSASLTDNGIHVWDVQHPWIPIASMKDHTDIASGIEWVDTPASLAFGQANEPHSGGGSAGGGAEWEGLDYWQHMLACSKDGTLKLHSLADAFKPHQSLPTTALALNSRGHVAFSHDYIDRSCASLKIHRHFNLASSLFTVTDVSTSSSALQKFTNSPYGSFTADSTAIDDDAHTNAQRAMTGGGGGRMGQSGGGTQPPPLAPRVLGAHHHHHNHHTIPSGGAMVGIGGNVNGGGIVRLGAAQLQSLAATAVGNNSLEGSGIDGGGASGRRYTAYPSNTSSAASSTTSSPVPTMFPHAASQSPTPRAIVALVSMQNVNRANELEDIFQGDENALWVAQDRLELMQQQFEHVSLLKDAFGFDEEVFRFLATQYIFVDEKMSFSDKCAHNALAVFVAGNAHLSQMWRILDVLYNGEDPDGKTGQPAAAATAPGPGEGEDHHESTSQLGPLDLTDLADHTNEHDPLSRHHHSHHHNLEDSQHSTTSFSRKDFDIDEFSSTTSSMMIMGGGGHPQGGGGGGHGGAAGNNSSHGGGHGGGTAGTTHTATLLHQLDQVNPQAMQGFDPYPYDAQAGVVASVTSGPNSNEKENHHHHRNNSGFPGLPNTTNSKSSSASSSSKILHGSAVHGDLGHLRAAALKDLLEYYVDNGDLQTAVAVAFVANSIVSVEEIMGKPWLQQIYMHYIELLHQLRMYQAANELILHCSDPSIRQMNQRSTSVYFNCANCTKPCETTLNADGEPVNPYLCTNCSNPTTRCSICRLPVRGLYVWCPVCSHGGHLEHLADWFRDEEVCPTGCAHKCSFNFGDTRHG